MAYIISRQCNEHVYYVVSVKINWEYIYTTWKKNTQNNKKQKTKTKQKKQQQQQKTLFIDKFRCTYSQIFKSVTLMPVESSRYGYTSHIMLSTKAKQKQGKK